MLGAMSSASHSPSSASTDAADVFDVRTIPCRIKHGQIVQRWLDLPVGHHFVLVNDHDPIPLRYQFEAEFRDAFSWEYVVRGPDEFRVRITKRAPVPAAAPLATAVPACGSSPAAVDGARDLDVRGLEPPEPLIRVLDALESLPDGAKLRARTDREPCHLFGEATQRGFSYECNEQPDGSWITVLVHA